MADQFAVYGNPGRNRSVPYFVVVQSNRFRQTARRVVAPLIDARIFQAHASDIGPHFVVEGNVVILDPLQVAHVSKDVLNRMVTSLAEHEDQIMNAIDVMLSRAWR